MDKTVGGGGGVITLLKNSLVLNILNLLYSKQGVKYAANHDFR